MTDDEGKDRDPETRIRSLDTAFHKGDTSNRPETRFAVMRAGIPDELPAHGGTASAPCSSAVSCSCIAQTACHPCGSHFW
ncbi:MAG: hypothetical protein MZU84_04895 [Sphingobacterium sp.]|nr:hypothetical protein [Sphingobacterium sp.]